MKAKSFKEYRAPKPKVKRDKSICIGTGKRKFNEEIAKKRAQHSDDIKGGMVAYKCEYPNHWHIGHKLF